MKKVEHTLDTLPPLTEAQKADLRRLAAKPDAEIDTSDIPELTDTQLAEMKRPSISGRSRNRSQRVWMPTCLPGSRLAAKATNPA